MAVLYGRPREKPILFRLALCSAHSGSLFKKKKKKIIKFSKYSAMCLIMFLELWGSNSPWKCGENTFFFKHDPTSNHHPIFTTIKKSRNLHCILDSTRAQPHPYHQNQQTICILSWGRPYACPMPLIQVGVTKNIKNPVFTISSDCHGSKTHMGCR